MNSSIAVERRGNIRDKSAKIRRGFNTYYDYSLLFLTIFLVVFGLVMIYSASSYIAQRDFNDAGVFFRGQLFAAVLGVVAMILISKTNYRNYTRKTRFFGLSMIKLLYIICAISQLYVLFFGVESHGKKRWIDLGFTTFQPSELTKVAVILFVAYIVQLSPRKLDSLGGFLIIFALNIPVIALIAKANLSTALIVAAIVIGICFTASRRTWYYIVFGIVGVACVAAYVFLGSESYRAERVAVWLNVDTEPKGYQILQGLYAIASGGVFGTGLGQSKQKLGFIPEAHNDMIFTVVCEELGIFGAISLIALFVFLLYRIFVISINAPDLFGSLICVGVFTHIAFQVILNIAVVTNAVPSTGVPLPFISYGGTSVAILMIEIGIVLSVSNQIKHSAKS